VDGPVRKPSGAIHLNTLTSGQAACGSAHQFSKPVESLQLVACRKYLYFGGNCEETGV
jgi:hypothetical protein